MTPNEIPCTVLLWKKRNQKTPATVDPKISLDLGHMGSENEIPNRDP